MRDFYSLRVNSLITTRNDSNFIKLPNLLSKALLLLLLSGSAGIGLGQTLIAGWDFQTTATGGTAAAAAPGSPSIYTANFGSGNIYLNGTNGSSSWITATTGNEVTSFGGTTVNAGTGFSTITSGTSALALLGGTSNSANGKSIVFKFSMSGYKDLVVSYATQKTATGFATQQWDYSTNGTSWTAVQSISTIPTSYATQTLSTITGLDNATNGYLRLTFSGATAAAGNNRLDNVQLNATAITASSYSGVAAGVGTEPASITSLTTALTGAVAPQQNAVVNFDFTVTDDANTVSGNDALPTLINQIVIGQGTGNDVTVWTQSIAGAQLSDGTSTQNGIIASNSITFSSIPTATLGNVADNSTKTYTLKIWLNTTMGGTLASFIDHYNLTFKIDRTSFTTATSATSTQFESGAGTAVESGAANNEISVVKTALNYTTQPAPTTININSSFTTVAIIKAQDVNGNTDLDFVEAITSVNNSQGFTTTNPPSVGNTFSAGTYTFPSNFQFASGGASATTVNIETAFFSGAGAVSTPITVLPPSPEINLKQGTSNYLTTSTYAFGSAVWGSNNDIIFTIENTGTTNLTLSAPIVSGTGFSLQAGLGATTVAPSGTTTFTIRFTPNAIGSFTGAVSITNNDGDENPYVINFSGTGTPNALSTITTDASYSYTSDIAYASYQSTPVPTSAASSVGVHNIIITDGADADDLPTILNAITFSYTGTAGTIRSAALFTTTNSKIADATTVNPSSLAFSGLSISTGSDGGAIQVILRITFTTAVTDNDKLVFTVSSAAAAASGSSLFSSYTAVSDNNSGNNRNRIEVTATKLAFVQGPSDASVNANMSPSPTVAANDANGNRDLDYTATVSLFSTGTLSVSPQTAAASSGLATFSTVNHTATGTGLYLSASSGSLTATGNSPTSFAITTIVYVDGDFMTNTGGTWNINGTGTATWYKRISGSFQPTTEIPNGTAGSYTVYITQNVNVPSTGSSGTFATAKLYVTNNAKFTYSWTSSQFTFRNILIDNGATIEMDGRFTVLSTGDLEIMDGGTFIYSYTSNSGATSFLTSTLWNGIEKFHPNSNFIVKNHETGSGNYFLPPAANLTSNTYNGVTAYFGNLIIASTGGEVRLTTTNLSNATTYLTHGNLEFTTSTAYNLFYGSGTWVVGKNLVFNSGSTGNLTVTTSALTINLNVKGDFLNNSTQIFRLANNASGANVTLNVDGNLTLNSGSLDLNFTSGSSGNVSLKGDLLVASGALLLAANANTATFNFSGTGDGTTAALTQTIDIASTGANRNQNLAFNVTSGAYVQLANRDLELGTGSSFNVKTGGVFDFYFASAVSTTANNIKIVSGATSTVFSNEANSTLKISSPGGLIIDVATYGTSTGNLQGVLSSGRTSMSKVANFWYIGRANQSTGDAIGIGPGSSNAKQIIVAMANNTLQLTPLGIYGFSNTTTCSSTGGKLDIRTGQVVETSTAYCESSSGTLYMAAGTLYKIAKGSADATTAYGDLIPRMNGGSFPYILNGGTIEFAGTGAGNYFQVVRSNSASYNYKYLNFSGNNSPYAGGGSPTDYKGVSSRTDVDSAVLISNNTVVKCVSSSDAAAPLAGDGGLIMTGGWLMIKKLNAASPELTATNAGTSYSLSGGTIEFYGSGAGQQQQIRAKYGSPSTSISYYNIEINAAAANYNSVIATAGNVDPSGSFLLQRTMNVNAPAVLRMDKDESITDAGGLSNFKLNVGAGLLYGGSEGTPSSAIEGLEASGTGVNSGNIRTANRGFSTGASYGFVSGGDMPTGSGLPSTVAALYAYKTNATDQVTLTNPVTVAGTGSLLNLNNGVLMTTASKLITLNPESIVSGGSSNSFIHGPLAKITDNTNTPLGSYEFTFPVGKTTYPTKYKPVSILPVTASGSTTYTAEFFNPASTTTIDNPEPFLGSLTAILKDQYWKVDRTGTGKAKVAIDYAPGGNPSDWVFASSTASPTSIPTSTNVAVVHDNGSTWDFTKATGNFNDQGPIYEARFYNMSGKIYSDTMDNFSPFSIGFAYNVILPVKLISFTGRIVAADGKLNWNIADAADLAGFELEYSTDGRNYKKLADIAASNATGYSFLHRALPAGANYYRLLIKDKNGKSFYSQVVLLSVGQPRTYLVSVSPTIVSDKLVPVIYSAGKQALEVVVTDALGRRIMHNKTIMEAGPNQWHINTASLARGMYFVTFVSTDGLHETRRFLKE